MTMGVALEPACELLRALRVEGRRRGDSAAVRRLLRSTLLAEDEVSTGKAKGGREGKAKDGSGGRDGSAPRVSGSCSCSDCCECMRCLGSTPASRRKSAHV